MAETATQTDDKSTKTSTDETSNDSTKTYSQEEVERLVSDRVGRVRSEYSDAEDKAKKFDELQEASKTDLERLTGERDKFKTEIESASAENLRLRVAIDKQLPSELVDRLRGATKEELEADADSLLQLVKPSSTTSFDGGKGREGATTPDSMNDLLRKAAGR